MEGIASERALALAVRLWRKRLRVIQRGESPHTELLEIRYMTIVETTHLFRELVVRPEKQFGDGDVQVLLGRFRQWHEQAAVVDRQLPQFLGQPQVNLPLETVFGGMYAQFEAGARSERKVKGLLDAV